MCIVILNMLLSRKTKGDTERERTHEREKNPIVFDSKGFCTKQNASISIYRNEKEKNQSRERPRVRERENERKWGEYLDKNDAGKKKKHRKVTTTT